MERESILDYTRPTPLQPHSGDGRALLALLVTSFFLLTFFAIVALHIPGIAVAGQELSLRRSIFAAVNATTLTGFQQDVGSPLLGADVLRLVLTLGGTLFALTAGGMAVVRIARMDYTDGQVARAATVMTLAATVGGAAFLFDTDRGGLIAALLQSASAFGNSGLYAGQLPGVLDWRTHAILMPLAFAGAVGMPVLMELFDRITSAHRLSAHSSTVLVLAAAFYLAGFALLAVLGGAHTPSDPAERASAWRYNIALASVFSVDARTAGLPFEFAAAFTRPAQWVLIALMIVGGSPGGAAGGLKTTTVAHLALGLRDSLRGRRASRAFGLAGCWTLIYFAIAVIGFLLLLHTEPDIAADRLLLLAFSAVSNVGLSHDPVSITGNGLFTLSGMMFAGRLAPLGMLWWMASRESDGGGEVAVS